MATQTPGGTSGSLEPTRTRYWVIVFAVTLALVTYIHRVCISLAAPVISADLKLSKVQMGWVFSAFVVAYSAFEIPGGYLSDRYGPRRVLTWVVTWWSIFTAATGWAWGFLSLAVARFLFGAGQAAGFPNLTKAFTIWLPKTERVRAQGIMWMSARWGGALAPGLAYLAIQAVGWRVTFALFGALGVIWAAIFWAWYRDNPRDQKSVNAAELALLEDAGRHAAGHGDVPWGKMLRSRQVWLLCLQYFCLGYGWYFYITWLPTYLKEARGLELGKSALFSGLPLFFGGIGSIFCGFALSRVAQRIGSVAKARRLMACIGFSGATVMLLVASQLKDPLAAMLAMGLASFSNDLAMPPSWGAAMDIGGKYAGTLSGAMNRVGNFGGIISPPSIGYILQVTGNWQLTFIISSAVYFAGVFCWMFLDPVTPFDPSAEAH